MISGNAFESLKRIIEVGSDRRVTMHGVYTPSILIGDVNIVSK